jgi:hypothetical protein
MSMASYFQKTTPIPPKFIINRDGVTQLTLGIDCSLTVAHLRTLLTERLSDLSENDQFIHSNGAPIHILDEQETIISELLLENSNVIFLKTKLTKEVMTAPNSTKLSQDKKSNKNTHLQSAVSQNQQETLTFKSNSETKSVRLSDLLSSATLEVDNANFSHTDMKRIISGLKQNKKVKQLKAKSGDCDVIEILAEVLKTNQTLTSLDILSGMDDDGCVLIANALIINHSLEKLNLSRNEITSTGCKAIGEMLKTNRTLKYLNICRNNLRDKGIKFICDAVMINPTLCHLDIYQTKMSSNGCALVAEMLRVNRTLTLIDIGDNNISDNDITVIADALKYNNTLNELDVKWNNITERGALALIDTLKTNRTLKTIKLQFNSMPDDVKVQINQKASQLKTTGLDICSIM